jgi:hypothetical protein
LIDFCLAIEKREIKVNEAQKNANPVVVPLRRIKEFCAVHFFNQI